MRGLSRKIRLRAGDRHPAVRLLHDEHTTHHRTPLISGWPLCASIGSPPGPVRFIGAAAGIVMFMGMLIAMTVSAFALSGRAADFGESATGAARRAGVGAAFAAGTGEP